jgi:hypothetical protein
MCFNQPPAAHWRDTSAPKSDSRVGLKQQATHLPTCPRRCRHVPPVSNAPAAASRSCPPDCRAMMMPDEKVRSRQIHRQHLNPRGRDDARAEEDSASKMEALLGGYHSGYLKTPSVPTLASQGIDKNSQMVGFTVGFQIPHRLTKVGLAKGGQPYQSTGFSKNPELQPLLPKASTKTAGQITRPASDRLHPRVRAPFHTPRPPSS